jgi:hypothetical protein
MRLAKGVTRMGEMRNVHRSADETLQVSTWETWVEDNIKLDLRETGN